MLQPRLRGSTTAAREGSLSTLAAAFNTLTLCSKHAHLRPQLPLTITRHASHAAQGRANGPGDSAGRRLGAKKTASEYVIPGNIIYKQRGTLWFPGENASIGKDHTIYATERGYVRYYKNPALHPKRRYIGVALAKEGPGSKLPTPANAPTRRRLGMHAAPIKEQSDSEFLMAHLSVNSKGSRDDGSGDSGDMRPTPTLTPTPTRVSNTSRTLAFKPGTFWPSNYEIGKVMEQHAGNVRDYDRKDRWLAWRKRSKKVKEGLIARAAKANRKTKGKKSNKGAPVLKK